MAVHLMHGGRVVDAHRDFGRAGGQSEHQIFLAGLLPGAKYPMNPLPVRKPKRLQMLKFWHNKRRKMSPATKKKIGAPSHPLNIEDTQGNKTGAPSHPVGENIEIQPPSHIVGNN